MSENLSNTEFGNIQEKVKQRPLNRKKLLRRTIITASMAVIFGVLACITFLVLEPVFSNILHPEEEPELVEIPMDTDEILPEDMIMEEDQIKESPVQIIEHTTDVDPIAVYRDQYMDLNKVAGLVQKSVVKITSVSQDTDWFDNYYESKNSTPGLYITDNNKELLFLCRTDVIEKAEVINVTLNDKSIAEGYIKASDPNTGLSIVAVPMEGLAQSITDNMSPVTLANSRVSTILATPIIAVGRPYGSSESVGYGILTSKGSYVNLTDQNYELLTTDIYGSSEATGVIVNLKGEILGIIDQSHNTADMKNIISAIGISDIKRTIERMSNGKPRAYLGINGTDVTEEINAASGVPVGAFVTGIVMDSPAMNAGIQSGDVIIRIGDKQIEKYADFTEYIESATPDSNVSLALMRQSGEEYREIELEVTLEEMS